MTKQDAERMKRALTEAGECAYVCDYGPGRKTVCVLVDGVEHEYRDLAEFNTGRPARVGPPAGPNEMRSYPTHGLSLRWAQ